MDLNGLVEHVDMIAPGDDNDNRHRSTRSLIDIRTQMGRGTDERSSIIIERSRTDLSQGVVRTRRHRHSDRRRQSDRRCSSAAAGKTLFVEQLLASALEGVESAIHGIDSRVALGEARTASRVTSARSHRQTPCYGDDIPNGVVAVISSTSTCARLRNTGARVLVEPDGAGFKWRRGWGTSRARTRRGIRRHPEAQASDHASERSQASSTSAPPGAGIEAYVFIRYHWQTPTSR